MPIFLKRLFSFLIFSSGPILVLATNHFTRQSLYKANNPYFQYVGRVDFSNPLEPRFWMPGVYIRAEFEGNHCKIFLNDQLQDSTLHNYVEIDIDHQKPFKVRITKKQDTIDISQFLHNGKHSLLFCKSTESGLGYVEFLGLACKKLLSPKPLPKRKIEFIGNSITCGYGNDAGTPCSIGNRYDHENSCEGYGPITARALGAQWHVSAVSGIGMIHSCCKITILMPEVFNKMDMRSDSVTWNFKNYIPDVVTICLGQNDGIQDSTSFCSAYVNFIEKIRQYYPNAKIICLNSPMANEKLNPVLKNYINSIVADRNQSGDKSVYKFFFDKRFVEGCYGHPSSQEDRELADRLTGFIRSITGW